MAIGNPGAAGAGNVNPAQQNAQAQQTANQVAKQLESATDAMKAVTEVFDTEAQGVGSKQVKQSSGDSQQSGQAVKDGSHSATGSEAYAASIAANEELEKKKRKKKIQSWEEKMATLESMGEVLDPEDVPKEEQGIVKNFLKNLHTIRDLRGKLKKLKNEREQLEAMLEAAKRDVSNTKTPPPTQGG